MRARLVLLGTGTCRLEPDRAASSVLIELSRSRVVFDFGRGVARRLVERGLRQDDVSDVVLSHFHPDHLSDLVAYLHAGLYSPSDPRSRNLRIYGPSGVERVVERILEIVGFPAPSEAPFRVCSREVAGSIEIGDLAAEFLPLPPAGNHGLRFTHGTRSYALTGDSHFHASEIDFLRGVDLGVVDAGHLDDGELVDLAVRSGARILVCSHLYRELDLVRLNRRAGLRGFEGRFLEGRDGMTFAL